MTSKNEAVIIETVEYSYVGSDKQFNNFLRNVIREYVVDDKLAADTVTKENVTETKER